MDVTSERVIFIIPWKLLFRSGVDTTYIPIMGIWSICVMARVMGVFVFPVVGYVYCIQGTTISCRPT